MKEDFFSEDCLDSEALEVFFRASSSSLYSDIALAANVDSVVTAVVELCVEFLNDGRVDGLREVGSSSFLVLCLARATSP